MDLSRVPPGVQYFFDEDVSLRRSIERDVLGVFAGWSYSEIILPIFDSYELFAPALGEHLDERAYRFAARDGRTVALRPDLTSLVARTVATRLRDRARPLRLCYTGEVFRADEPRRGRQHEFHQLGVELVGWASPEADVEVLLVALEALRRLGLDDARVTVGHTQFLGGIGERLGLSPEEEAEMRRLVDRRQTAALDRFLEPHASAAERADFCRLVSLGGGRDVLDLARALVGNPRSVAAIEQLAGVYDTLEALGLASRVDLDLGDVAALDYYTGMTFKVYAPGWGLALGGGGRYDALLARFGRDEAAVGFSLSLDWLAGALAARGLDVERTRAPKRESLAAGTDLTGLFAKAIALRRAGQPVEITPGAEAPRDATGEEAE
jgi:ATP phosphoribosyltransferase regulatory subunit